MRFSMLDQILSSQLNFDFIQMGSYDVFNRVNSARIIQWQEEKRWLPRPCVPPQLREDSRKHLNHSRECANQELIIGMTINNIA
ncbi:hypothetical protein AAZX31_01G112000 [Glycine max]